MTQRTVSLGWIPLLVIAAVVCVGCSLPFEEPLGSGSPELAGLDQEGSCQPESEELELEIGDDRNRETLTVRLCHPPGDEDPDLYLDLRLRSAPPWRGYRGAATPLGILRTRSAFPEVRCAIDCTFTDHLQLSIPKSQWANRPPGPLMLWLTGPRFLRSEPFLLPETWLKRILPAPPGPKAPKP